VKLNYKNTVLIGFAFFSICAFWQLYDSLIPLMLKNAFSLGDTVSGLIMASDNILALFLLPFFGTLSDRTHTRIGRRMPLSLVGRWWPPLPCCFCPWPKACATSAFSPPPSSSR